MVYVQGRFLSPLYNVYAWCPHGAIAFDYHTVYHDGDLWRKTSFKLLSHILSFVVVKVLHWNLALSQSRVYVRGQLAPNPNRYPRASHGRVFRDKFCSVHAVKDV